MSTKSKGVLNKRIQYSSVISIVILVLLLLFLSVLNRDFLSLTTRTNVMFQVPAIGVVALGAMVVIISGGIDFSAGYGISMIGMAAGLVI